MFEFLEWNVFIICIMYMRAIFLMYCYYHNLSSFVLTGLHQVLVNADNRHPILN